MLLATSAQPGAWHRVRADWLIEAVRYNVLPLDDRKAERGNADIAGRPTLIRGNTQMLYSGMVGLGENLVVHIKNKSHAVTAQLLIPEDGANGAILAQGGVFGGWAIYANDGRLTYYYYNLLGVQQFKIQSEKPIPPGEHQVRMEFAYDGGGLGRGGTISLSIDGEKTGEGRLDRTQPNIFSPDDKTDVGVDRGTAVSPDDTSATSAFNGRIDWIQLDLGEDANNPAHQISEDERFRIKNGAAIAPHPEIQAPPIIPPPRSSGERSRRHAARLKQDRQPMRRDRVPVTHQTPAPGAPCKHSGRNESLIRPRSGAR
jgi:hypothetical protein